MWSEKIFMRGYICRFDAMCEEGARLSSRNRCSLMRCVEPMGTSGTAIVMTFPAQLCPSFPYLEVVVQCSELNCIPPAQSVWVADGHRCPLSHCLGVLFRNVIG